MKKSVLKGKLRNSIKATLMSGVVLLAAIPVISNGISFEVSAIEQKVLPEKYYKTSIRRCKKTYKESLKKAYDMYIKAIPTWIEYSDNLDKLGKCYVNAVSELASKFVETISKIREVLDEEDCKSKEENSEDEVKHDNVYAYGVRCQNIINDFYTYSKELLNNTQEIFQILENKVDHTRAISKWSKTTLPGTEFKSMPSFNGKSYFKA